MEVQTKYFGKMKIADEEMIHFAEGIFGFEDKKRFVLIRFDNENNSLLCLQSIDDSNLAFTVMNPFAFMRDYTPIPNASDVQKLGANKYTDLFFYNMCAIRPNIKESTVNLRCPILVNPENNQAMQVILDDKQYAFQHPFSALIKED